MNKKGQIFTLFIFGILVLLLILMIIFSIIGIPIKTTENGEHTGYVTATETNGIFFKTDRVYFKTDTESTQEDIYCVIDKNIKLELELAQRSKKQITIEFYSLMGYGWSKCKSGELGIIIGIK